MYLEREISCQEFYDKTPVDENRQQMEFRVIQKISSHKDHASNFFVSANATFFKLNRHKDLLPYNHSRVKLTQNPYVIPVKPVEDKCSDFSYDLDEVEL